MPPEDFYEGYPQLDNGVGMVTSMKTEFMRELEYIDDYKKDFTPRHKSLATGRAAYPLIAHMARKLCEAVKGLVVDVYLIENHFFGENITVAGLVTGKDLAEQLAGQELGDELLLPDVMLRDGEDVFLCGMTVDELSEKLGVKITVVAIDGAEFIEKMLG